MSGFLESRRFRLVSHILHAYQLVPLQRTPKIKHIMDMQQLWNTKFLQQHFRVCWSDYHQTHSKTSLESRRFHRASRLLLMLWMFKQTDLNLLSNFFIGADFNGGEQWSGNSDVSELSEVSFINKSSLEMSLM
jgi:hypothetical protein